MSEKKSVLTSPISQPPVHKRRWLRAQVLMALVIPNVAFLGVHYAARSLPVEPIRDHIAIAIGRGDILTDPKTFDILYLDSARGVEPWGDANCLRAAIYRGPSKWKDALAPRFLEPADGVGRHPAEDLGGAMLGTLAFDPQSGYYHRYWHGNVAITAFLLSVFDVRQARLTLMNASYFLFMLIPLLAYAHSKTLGIVLGVISGFGICFSGLPYHGQTFAYAPAFIWSQFAVLPVLWLRRTVAPDESFVLLGLILGAIAAFVEPMSGAFVMGGCLFFLTIYFSQTETGHRQEAFRSAATALAAFLAGVICSFLFKQTITALFFGWDQTFGVLLTKLWSRMGLTGERVTTLQVVGALSNNSIYLTFGSPWLRKLLVRGSGAAFLAGSILIAVDMRRNKWSDRFFDYIAVLGCMVMILVWYTVLPSHTVIHAWITVRLLYIPFAVSWVLLWLSVQATFTPRRKKSKNTKGN
jgi:hypothetical protein